MYSETRARAREAVRRFAVECGAKYPEALKHLRTSNVVEPPVAAVRLRQRVTKGAGSRTKGLLMAYNLLAIAQVRWRRLDGAHHLPLVREDHPRETRAAGRWRVEHGAEHHSFTGVRMGAPLAFSSITTNLAGSVLLALRPTT
jgi:hypothetical protein